MSKYLISSHHRKPWTQDQKLILKNAVKSGYKAPEIQKKYFPERTECAVQKIIARDFPRKLIRYDIADIFEAFLNVGLELKSRKYQNQDDKLKYKCFECGYEDQKSSGNVVNKPAVSGCPRCNNKIVLFSDLFLIAKARGGKCKEKCSPKARASATKKYKWECKAGDTFSKNYNKIKSGQWCSICSSYLGERIVRAIIEHLTSLKFPKTRSLDWLKTSAGTHLELDGFNAEHKLAFEHHGRQHYIANSRFAKGVSFEKLKSRDRLKSKLCKENGVSIVYTKELFSDLPLKEAQKVIANQLLRFGFKIDPERLKADADLSAAYSLSLNEAHSEIKKIIKEKKGVLKGKLPIQLKDSFSVWCKIPEHKSFTPNYNRLRNGSWCRRCSATVGAAPRKASLKSINETLKKHKKHYYCSSPKDKISGKPETILEFTCKKTNQKFPGAYSYYVNKSHARCQVCFPKVNKK